MTVDAFYKVLAERDEANQKHRETVIGQLAELKTEVHALHDSTNGQHTRVRDDLRALQVRVESVPTVADCVKCDERVTAKVEQAKKDAVTEAVKEIKQTTVEVKKARTDWIRPLVMSFVGSALTLIAGVLLYAITH